MLNQLGPWLVTPFQTDPGGWILYLFQGRSSDHENNNIPPQNWVHFIRTDIVPLDMFFSCFQQVL